MSRIFLTVLRIYRVSGVTFEWHNYIGQTIINRHTEQERNYKNISLRNWAAINKFVSMPDDVRELHRIF